MRKPLVIGVLGLALMLGGQRAIAVPMAPEQMASRDQATYQAHLAAAQAGDANAQYQLAVDYYVGFGVGSDLPKAVPWLKKAAEQNHPDAMRMLGEWYLDGTGVERNATVGIRWLEQAATKGNARAQYLLSGIYEKGEDVSKDTERSRAFLRQAAEQGESDACFELGRRYWTAEGPERSLMDAARWFGKAAEQDHELAMIALAALAMEAARRGTEYNPKMIEVAMRWYERAADLGNVTAQVQLATAYHQGAGRPKDPLTAAMWAALANRGPAMGPMDVKYRELLRTNSAAIGTGLTPAQQQEVDGRVTAWIAAHPDVLRVNAVATPDGWEARVTIKGQKRPESQVPQPTAKPVTP